MGEPCIGHRLVTRTEMGDGVGDVGGVPEHDRGDDEVEAGGTKLLRLGTAVGNPALFEGADDLREEMKLLALVEPGMAASALFRAFEPVEHEQRAFDPPQLLECEVELVLAAVGREFSQHDGRRHDAGLQRRAPYRCGRCGCCGSAGTAALARRRRGQPPRGSRGCAPCPSHGAFCRSRALDREHQAVSALAQAPVVMLVTHLLALMGCKTLPRVPVSRTRRPETASRRARA
jgi:hypothetical protein